MKKSIISRKNLFLLLGIFLLGIAINFSNIVNALTLNQVMQRSPAFHLLKDIYTVINGEYVPIATESGKINASLIEGTVKGANYWNLSGSNLYPSDTSWNVGIGTTTPEAKLDVNGNAKIRGDLDMNGNRITNVAAPIASSDAATKGYVDAQVGGGGYSECYAFASGSNANCAPGYTTIVSTRGDGCGITIGHPLTAVMPAGWVRVRITYLGENCQGVSTGYNWECLEVLNGGTWVVLASIECAESAIYHPYASTVALCCK